MRLCLVGAYDAKLLRSGRRRDKESDGDASAGATPPKEVPPVGSVVLNSFNPIVRVAWLAPETLFVQTAFVRFYRNDPVPVFSYARWHVVRLYPQAAVVN